MRSWDPFVEMETLRREVDRVFNSHAPVTRGGSGVGAFLPGRSARAYPLINLSEDNEGFTVEALAPGIDPEKLDITVVRNSLTLSGEKPAPEGIKSEQYHRSERSAGRFVRQISLPTEVDGDKVAARYNDGILRITLPKVEAAKPRQIKVAL